LPNRASHFAAQATVRVRWTNRRGAILTHGLERPRGLRTPACHRDPDTIRTATIRVTRGYGLSIRRNPLPGSLRDPTSPDRRGEDPVSLR
jgi:hypothetical protein